MAEYLSLERNVVAATAAAKYIDAFMQNVNWEEVDRRAEAAAKTGPV